MQDWPKHRGTIAADIRTGAARLSHLCSNDIVQCISSRFHSSNVQFGNICVFFLSFLLLAGWAT